MLKFQKSSVATGLFAGAIVLTLSAALGSFYIILNREYLRQSLNKEKLGHERALSEKLVTDKELVHKTEQLDQMEAANQQLTSFLGHTVTSVKDKDHVISALAQNNQDIRDVRSQLKNMDGDTEALEQHITKLNKTLDQLVNKNNQLVKQVNQLSLESQQQKATSNVITIHKGIGRAFRVEAWRARGRELTTRAKRTQKLVVSFEPSDRHEFMKIKKDVFYVIMSDESGAIYNVLKGQKQTVYLDGNPVDILPSFELKAEEAEQINRISVAIEALSGLQPGVYNFDIYTNNAYVGNTQIRLN